MPSWDRGSAGAPLGSSPKALHRRVCHLVQLNDPLQLSSNQAIPQCHQKGEGCHEERRFFRRGVAVVAG
jgi:hypothetical protein